jgi:hypothetical protein
VSSVSFVALLKAKSYPFIRDKGGNYFKIALKPYASQEIQC